MSSFLGQQPDVASDILNDPTMSEEDRQRLLRATENMDPSMLQDFMVSIAGMTGEERKAAIEGISRPYEEERDTLRDELEQNYDMLTADNPKGGMAGNNQFSVYVGASPVEHIASGVGKFMAGRDLKANREAMRGLNKQQGDAMEGMMDSSITALEARATADALRNGTPMQSDAPGLGIANKIGEWMKKRPKRR